MEDQVEGYLNAYIEGHVDPGTAVLITGPWGCGKTRLIKNYFGLTAAKQPERPKALIASFFGADSHQDLINQFAAQRHPKLTSPEMQAMGALMMRGLRFADGKFTGGSLLSGNEGSGLLKWLGEPGSHVLVFDDFERSSMPLAERLAVVNRYVEGVGLKVIVIANESELGEDPVYQRWKEKVIGKTLRVGAEAEQVLREVASELSVQSLRDCVLGNLKLLAGVLKALDSVNYRSVRALIFDVQRLVVAAPRLERSSKVMLSLLSFSVAVGSLLRSDTIGRAQVDLAETVKALGSNAKRSEKDRRLIEVHGRLSTMGALDPIISPAMMARLWCDGEIDDQYLEQVLSTHRLIVGDQAQPAWQWLREPGKIGVARFREQKSRLLDEIHNGRIYDAGILLHVVDSHLQLFELGDGLLPRETQVKAWLEAYLKTYQVRLTDEDLGGGRELSTMQYAGYIYHSSGKTFNAAADVIREHIARKRTDELQGETRKWMQDISEGRLDALQFNENEQPGEQPWLHLVDAQEFATLLLDDGCVRSRLLDALTHRYARDGRGVLESEWPWLKRLKEVLMSMAGELAPPHQKLASNAFTGAFNYIESELGVARRHLDERLEFDRKMLAPEGT